MDLAGLEVCVAPARLDGELFRVGVATEPGVDRRGAYPVVYCEWHAGADLEDVTVWYADAQGELMAKMVLSFSSGKLTPTFEQIDYRSGETRKTLRSGDNWYLMYQPDHQSDLQREIFAADDIEVLGPGFVGAVEYFWRDLETDNRVVLAFGSTVLQKTINLRLSSVDSKYCQSVATAHRCFWIEPDNVFLRMLFDQIELGFDREKKLVLYRGLVNVQDNAGKKQKLEIHYHY